MECPICKNKIGFCFGTCIKCGYNYLSGEFKTITINTRVLKQLVPIDVYHTLVNIHEEQKRK